MFRGRFHLLRNEKNKEGENYVASKIDLTILFLRYNHNEGAPEGVTTNGIAPRPCPLVGCNKFCRADSSLLAHAFWAKS